MYISPLRNNVKNISFGYNKRFHKEIQKNLEQRNSRRANYLSKTDEQLNALEDKILLFEKMHLSRTIKYRELTDKLVKYKISLAQDMDKYDSSLNYSKSVSACYRLEALSKTAMEQVEWRRKLAKSIGELNEEEKQKIKDQIYDSLGLNVSRAGVKAKSGEADVSSLIPLYIPNEYSPQGFADVTGSKIIKETLADNLIPYFSTKEERKQDYLDYGIRQPRGFLFYGPPGCGKTYIAQALSAEIGAKMYTMDVSKVGAMWINKSSNNIRDAFDYVFSKAKESNKPIILFMDEVDSLALNRSSATSGSQEDSKVVTTLLKMVEAARDNNVLVIAATNRYDMLDAAFKDRFDAQIYFPLADAEQIENIVVRSLNSREKGKALAYNDEEIKELIPLFLGFSNRAIIEILDDAAKSARKRQRDDISFDDVISAIENSHHEKINESLYMPSSEKRQIGFSAFA